MTQSANTTPIFTEALTLLKSVEIHLVNETVSENHLFSYLKRLVWVPAKFLRMGMREKTKHASAWALLSFAFLMLGTWLVKSSGVEKTQVGNMVPLVSVIAPMFLVVFALPSLYGNCGVSPKTVQFVVEFLQARGISCTRDIELLKLSIKPFEDRARSRVSALKWMAGLLWAAFIYSSTKVIDDVSKLTVTESMSYMYISVGLFVSLIATYLCVWGYEAGLDKLFRAIDFGFNDFCHLTERASLSSADPGTSSNAKQ